MIAFRNFALRRGERLLLSGMDAALHAGWRIGVVGRNGAGKSSLFAAVMGELEADAGDIDRPARLRIASVAQETPGLPDSALDFVLGGDAEVAAARASEQAAMQAEDWEGVATAHQRLEELGGYDAEARAGRLLHGLGFPSDTHRQAVSAFSGGWRARLNLGRALMQPSDLLLLDEPTNHLDLDAVLWLEQWLLRYEGTLLLISHDREFLDGACTHILHLHEGRAKLYVGNYTSFERQSAEQLRQQQIAHEKEKAERAHLQAFVDRFRAKASKAKQAQSRIKRLEKLAGTEAVRAERALRISFPEPAKLPHSLLRLRHADCGYRGNGGVAKILEAVDFGLESGDRIGLLGRNGAGKSTLVKSLVGDIDLLAGERETHGDLVIGYFAQHTVEALRAGSSPVDHLREIAPDEPTQSFRDFLGRWNFPGDRAFESIDGFSGGERARLALALIAWQRPNLLLLDEPTNHLDLDMREALAEALSDFEGAIVLVSHDRHLIGLVSDRYWRVSKGHVAPFDGDLDDYAAWLRNRSESNADFKASAAATMTKASLAVDDRDHAQRRADANQRKRQQRRVGEIEARLPVLEKAMSDNDVELADPALYADQSKAPHLQSLLARGAGLREEKDALEAEWLTLHEALEASSP